MVPGTTDVALRPQHLLAHRLRHRSQSIGALFAMLDAHDPIRLPTVRNSPKLCWRKRRAADARALRIPPPPGTRTHSSVSSQGRELPCPWERGRTPRLHIARDSDTELTIRSGFGRACSAKYRPSDRRTRFGSLGPSSSSTSLGT